MSKDEYPHECPGCGAVLDDPSECEECGWEDEMASVPATDHTHPDHTCSRCRDEENRLRPDYVPRRTR